MAPAAATLRCGAHRENFEGDGAQAVVGADVEILQIFRARALGVFDFEDDLVLVGGLLDEVEIVLRVRVSEQRQHARDGHAVE